MNIIFIVLTGINALLYLYAFLIDLDHAIKNKTFQKAFKFGQNIVKKNEDDIDKNDGKTNKVTYQIGKIIAVVLVFVIYYWTVVYIPIYIGIKYSVESAIVTYLTILLITTLMKLFKYTKNNNFNVNKMILISLLAIFRFQIIIIILFGFNFKFDSVIQSIYSSEFYLSNTITILMPILFFASIIMTIYLYWIGVRVNSKINEDGKYRPQLSHSLIILVISSFTGLIYLFEMNIDTLNNTAYGRLLNLFMVALGSILIPSLFSAFDRNKKLT